MEPQWNDTGGKNEVLGEVHVPVPLRHTTNPTWTDLALCNERLVAFTF